MNELLAQPGKAWGSPDFVDPQLFDTRLSQRGIEEAKLLRHEIDTTPAIDLLCVSPLTRALQTAAYAFDTADRGRYRTVVSHLCAERLYLSSDVGRTAVQLQFEFRDFDFDHLGDSSWWFVPPPADYYQEWRPPGKYCCPGEPATVFAERMSMFKKWISHRAEKRIAVVTHWGVIRAMTGRSVPNCGIVTIQKSELLSRPLDSSDL